MIGTATLSDDDCQEKLPHWVKSFVLAAFFKHGLKSHVYDAIVDDSSVLESAIG